MEEEAKQLRDNNERDDDDDDDDDDTSSLRNQEQANDDEQDANPLPSSSSSPRDTMAATTTTVTTVLGSSEQTTAIDPNLPNQYSSTLCSVTGQQQPSKDETTDMDQEEKMMADSSSPDTTESSTASSRSSITTALETARTATTTKQETLQQGQQLSTSGGEENKQQDQIDVHDTTSQNRSTIRDGADDGALLLLRNTIAVVPRQQQRNQFVTGSVFQRRMGSQFSSTDSGNRIASSFHNQANTTSRTSATTSSSSFIQGASSFTENNNHGTSSSAATTSLFSHKRLIMDHPHRHSSSSFNSVASATSGGGVDTPNENNFRSSTTASLLSHKRIQHDSSATGQVGGGESETREARTADYPSSSLLLRHKRLFDSSITSPPFHLESITQQEEGDEEALPLPRPAADDDEEEVITFSHSPSPQPTVDDEEEVITFSHLPSPTSAEEEKEEDEEQEQSSQFTSSELLIHATLLEDEEQPSREQSRPMVVIDARIVQYSDPDQEGGSVPMKMTKRQQFLIAMTMCLILGSSLMGILFGGVVDDGTGTNSMEIVDSSGGNSVATMPRPSSVPIRPASAPTPTPSASPIKQKMFQVPSDPTRHPSLAPATKIPTAPPTTMSVVWRQLGADINNVAAGDNFGWSVALSADGFTVATGAPFNTKTGSNSGLVRVYRYSQFSLQWIQQGRDIDGVAANDQSGWSVALSGNGRIVAIGEYRLIDLNFNSDRAGRARIFAWDPATRQWNQHGQSLEGDANGDAFGHSIDLSFDGSILAVGGFGNDSNGALSGHVRVYEFMTENSRWVQHGQDLVGDSAFDFFGISVALSSDGSILAVGADGDNGGDALGGGAGHVRVFQFDTSLSEWKQFGQAIDGEASGDRSGFAVALSSDGQTVAIGAYGNDGINGVDSGHVRVWVLSAESSRWVQRGQDLDGEAASDQFGRSVALSSDGLTLAASAYQNDGNGDNSGHIRIYDYNSVAMQWEQVGKDLDGVASGDFFGGDMGGIALSADGSIVAGGSPLHAGNGAGGGHVRIFSRETSSTWIQLGVDIDGEAAGDKSGMSVSLSGDGFTVAIGAHENDNSNGVNSGHVRVYAFDASSLAWNQQGQDVDGVAANDHSGWSVALSGDGSILAIGEHLRLDGDTSTSDRAGRARIFGWDPETLQWYQLGQSLEGDANGDAFGYSVDLSLDGSIVAVGGFGNDSNGSFSGHARVFNYVTEDSQWVHRGQDLIGDSPLNLFGIGVALSSDGSILAVGADFDAGYVRVFFFDTSLSQWTQFGQDIVGEASGDHLGFAIALSSDGQTLAIGAYGFDGISGVDSGNVRVWSFSSDSSGWVQLGQGLDGEAAGDLFGRSVALSADGRTLAASAGDNDGNGENSGHVRIFDYSSLTRQWEQVGQDLNGEASFDFLGGDIGRQLVALSADGTIVAGGATFNDGENGRNSGHVRVFSRPNTSSRPFAPSVGPTQPTTHPPSTVCPTISPRAQAPSRLLPTLVTTWFQLGADIDGEAAGDKSGMSVALSADGFTVAIGAHENDNSNGINSGHVRVYVFDASSLAWNQQGQDVDGVAANDHSGWSVALSGDGSILAVGEHLGLEPDSTSDRAGRARIFGWDPETLQWYQLGQSLEGDANGDAFGYSLDLSLDGSIVAVGGFGNDSNGSFSGHARVFNYVAEDSQWVQRGQDLIGDSPLNLFGIGVALSSDGSILAVGADFDAGYVRAFSFDTSLSRWIQFGQDIVGEASGDRSGFAIALSSDGQTLAVGAYGNDSSTGVNAGHVRVWSFLSCSSRWEQLGQDLDGEAAGDFFGRSVALSADGRTLAASAERNDGNGESSGHVRIFDYNSLTLQWEQVGQDLDGEASFDFFGGDIGRQLVALSADGTIVAGGATFNDGENGRNSGHVRVYTSRPFSPSVVPTIGPTRKLSEASTVPPSTTTLPSATVFPSSTLSPSS